MKNVFTTTLSVISYYFTHTHIVTIFQLKICYLKTEAQKAQTHISKQPLTLQMFSKPRFYSRKFKKLPNFHTILYHTTCLSQGMNDEAAKEKNEKRYRRPLKVFGRKIESLGSCIFFIFSSEQALMYKKEERRLITARFARSTFNVSRKKLQKAYQCARAKNDASALDRWREKGFS